MSTFALLLDGTVVDIVAEQFPVHDSLSWLDVSNTNPQPQVGWTSDGSGTLAAPVLPGLTIAQQAQAALSAGVEIVSTSTPALNGTYACDSESRADLMAEMISVVVNSTFTNGSTTLGYADTSGTFHEFGLAEFKAFAVAVGGYVGAVKAVGIAGTGSLPSVTVTIA